MANSPSYVPILKGKEGEFAALQALRPDVQDQLMPLIEATGIPFDHASGRQGKELDEHVAPLAARLRKCWEGRALYLDLSRIGGSEFLRDGRVALEQVLAECAESGVLAVPVVALTSSSSFIAAAGKYATTSGAGICLRLVANDFQEDIDIDTEVGRILDNLSANGAVLADLIVDLEDLGQNVGQAALIARSVLSMIPGKADWRRLVLGAASFPEDLSDVDAATTTTLRRSEWDLWKALQRKPNALPRRDLIFSDYAIANPVVKELDPRTMRMSASIRYTTQDGWLILKGRNVRQHGFDQYFQLCKDLIDRPEYMGRGFSWGDWYIDQCALGMEGPGNATTWRKVGVNHHLTLVTQELARLGSGV